MADGLVLLKNEGALPLAGTERTALYGHRAAETMECGGCSTYITTPLHSNLLDELKKAGMNAFPGEAESADSNQARYHRVIYRCNQKYMGDKHCSTPHVKEEQLKQGFVNALTKLISRRDDIIAGLTEDAEMACSKPLLLSH